LVPSPQKQDPNDSRLAGRVWEEGISAIIDAGVVGINLEDCDKETQKMYSITEPTERIQRVFAMAKVKGVPDFVVNARTDALVHGEPLSEAITRGKAYLEAGATTVFVWGGSVRGRITRVEVEKLVQAFRGRLNVAMKISEGGLTRKELQRTGVARISIGSYSSVPCNREL
jgi:2-methylisocitrate lyase-like PEP mutase family enzyme